MLWYTFFGVGSVFQPPEVLFYLMLKQRQLVGRPSSSYGQNAEPQWCFTSVWVWEAFLPLLWLFTLCQIKIYDNWKGKCMLPMRHELMAVDGSVARCLANWYWYFLFFFPRNFRTFEDVVYVQITSHFRILEEFSETISLKRVCYTIFHKYCLYWRLLWLLLHSCFSRYISNQKWNSFAIILHELEMFEIYHNADFIDIKCKWHWPRMAVILKDYGAGIIL